MRGDGQTERSEVVGEDLEAAGSVVTSHGGALDGCGGCWFQRYV